MWFFFFNIFFLDSNFKMCVQDEKWPVPSFSSTSIFDKGLGGLERFNMTSTAISTRQTKTAASREIRRGKKSLKSQQEESTSSKWDDFFFFLRQYSREEKRVRHMRNGTQQHYYRSINIYIFFFRSIKTLERYSPTNRKETKKLRITYSPSHFLAVITSYQSRWAIGSWVYSKNKMRARPEKIIWWQKGFLLSLRQQRAKKTDESATR